MEDEELKHTIQTWKFPERDNPGLKVTQKEPDFRFIAFELPKNPGVTLPNYKGEYIDYFFDSEGNPRDFRRHDNFDTLVQIEGDYSITFRVHEWQDPLEHADLVEIIRLSKTSVYAAPIEGLIILNFKSMWNVTRQPLARLETASMGNIFGMDQNRNIIKASSPMIRLRLLTPGREEEGFTTEDWGFDTLSERNFTEKEPNKVLLLGKDGKPNSEVEWEVKDGILCYTQTHLPTQIRKVLKAPVKLDMSAVAGAVFAKPPYEREKEGFSGTDFLRVPWRHLPRIVGASLSFSVPKKENLD